MLRFADSDKSLIRILAGHRVEKKEQVAVRLPKAALAMIDHLVGSIYGTNRGKVARSLIIAQLQELAAQKVITLRLQNDDD
jgi:hypothetical protein